MHSWKYSLENKLLNTLLVLQNLKQQEAVIAMSLTFLNRTSIALGRQPYDAAKSKVCLQLTATDEQKWKPFANKPLTLVSYDRNGHSAQHCGFGNYPQ